MAIARLYQEVGSKLSRDSSGLLGEEEDELARQFERGGRQYGVRRAPIVCPSVREGLSSIVSKSRSSLLGQNA